MRKKFIADYEYVQEGKKKAFRYYGAYYRMEASENVKKRIRLSLPIHAFIQFVLFIAMGLLNNDGMRQPYVVLLYGIMLIPVSYACYDAVCFAMRKRDMERMHYEGSFMRMFTSAIAMILMGGLMAFGEIFYILSTSAKSINELLFAIFSASSSVLAFLLFQKLRKIKTLIVITTPME